MPHSAMVIPGSVVSRADISRLIREVEAYSEAAYQAELRHAAAPSTSYASPGFQELERDNKEVFASAAARKALIEALRDFQQSAAQVHVSFASQPSVKAVQQIVAWFRRNTQPNIVVQVGVDPSIIGGCVVRTTNKVFTFSMADALRSSIKVLEKEVAAL